MLLLWKLCKACLQGTGAVFLQSFTHTLRSPARGQKAGVAEDHRLRFFFFCFPNSGPRLVRSRRASACVGLSTPNHTLLTVTSAPHTYVFMQSCSAQPLRRRTLAPRSPCFIARFEAQCDTSSKYHNPRLWSLLILDLVVLPASRSFLELVVSWYVVVERKRTESWICWKATIMTSRDLSFYAHFRPYFNAAPPVK